jgi:8-oxo-dGTP pyrophosphatase MutT (NUDIX family)
MLPAIVTFKLRQIYAHLHSRQHWANNCPDGIVEEQRRILGFLENSRQQFHPEHRAEAIRFVYVAWGVIFLDGKILMYHREDKSRKDAAGNFGLPGGRFQIEDAPSSFHSDEKMRDFAFGKSPWPLEFLGKTLVREIEEELELRQDDYAYTPLVDLDPYVKVEGSKNNHALTEYRIRLYSIQLNQRGLVRLFDAISQQPSSFSWFSEAELIAGRNSSGDTAFVDAIIEHKNLHPGLTLACESFKDMFLKPEESGCGITIPLTQNKPILNGKSGKPLAEIYADLTKIEHDWLMALACHAKGLAIENATCHRLLRCGWIHLNNAEDVATITRIKEKLELKGLTLIEILDGRYARLSTVPSAIFLDDKCFRYVIGSENSIGNFIELKLTSLDTAIGKTKALSRSAKVPYSVYQFFEYAASDKKNEYSQKADKANIPRMINQCLGNTQKEIGLRMLINYKSESFNVDQET